MSAPPASLWRKVKRSLVHASNRDRLIVGLMAATVVGCLVSFARRHDFDWLVLAGTNAASLAMNLRTLVEGLRHLRQDAYLVRRPYILARERRARSR